MPVFVKHTISRDNSGGYRTVFRGVEEFSRFLNSIHNFIKELFEYLPQHKTMQQIFNKDYRTALNTFLRSNTFFVLIIDNFFY